MLEYDFGTTPVFLLWSPDSRAGGVVVVVAAAVGSGVEVFFWRGENVTATENTTFTLYNTHHRGATSGWAVYQLLRRKKNSRVWWCGFDADFYAWREFWKLLGSKKQRLRQKWLDVFENFMFVFERYSLYVLITTTPRHIKYNQKPHHVSVYQYPEPQLVTAKITNALKLNRWLPNAVSLRSNFRITVL